MTPHGPSGLRGIQAFSPDSELVQVVSWDGLQGCWVSVQGSAPAFPHSPRCDLKQPVSMNYTQRVCFPEIGVLMVSVVPGGSLQASGESPRLRGHRLCGGH